MYLSVYDAYTSLEILRNAITLPEGQHGLQTMPDWAGFAASCPFFYVSQLRVLCTCLSSLIIKVTFDVVYNVIVVETLMYLMPRKRWTLDNSLVFSRLPRKILKALSKKIEQRRRR